jgi:hypothetical protein
MNLKLRIVNKSGARDIQKRQRAKQTEVCLALGVFADNRLEINQPDDAKMLEYPADHGHCVPSP